MSLAGALAIPVIIAAAVALITSWQVGFDASGRTAELLVKTAEARHPHYVVIPDRAWTDWYRECGVHNGSIPSPAVPKKEFFDWDPADAVVTLPILLDQWAEGVAEGSRFRFVEQNTSEVSRRFLIGCMDATLFAPLCASYTEQLVRRYPGPDPATQHRLDSYEQWKTKAVCTFMRGAQQRPERASPP